MEIYLLVGLVVVSYYLLEKWLPTRFRFGLPAKSVVVKYKPKQQHEPLLSTLDLTLTAVAFVLLLAYLPGVIFIYLSLSGAASSYLYVHGLVSILPSALLLLRRAKLGSAYWVFTALLLGLDGFVLLLLWALASDTSALNWH